MLSETESVGKALLLAITIGFGQMALILFLYMMSILYKKDCSDSKNQLNSEDNLTSEDKPSIRNKLNSYRGRSNIERIR